MTKEYSQTMPWAIAQIKNQHFALASQDVREMLMVPDVAEVPSAPSYVRGVINLRGRVIPLLDLRQRLGWNSLSDETESFCDLMDQREQDHQNWLNELEASVTERQQFTLTTDPHKCAFGKWRDQFHTDNLRMADILTRFDDPHRRIHGIAIQVGELAQKGDYQQAALEIERTRSTVLAEMLGLFAELRQAMRESLHEIAVVLDDSGNRIAAVVDSIVAVEKLEAGSVAPLPLGAKTKGGVICRLGMREKSKQPVLIVETDRLLEAESREQVLGAASAGDSQPPA